MTMDCSSAQQIVSAALDGEGRNPQEIDAAKEHCRSCLGCSTFLSTLAAIHRLPSPEVPEDLFRNTLEAIRTEAATNRIAASEEASEQESYAHPMTEEPMEAPGPDTAEIVESEPSTSTRPVIRPRWQGWAPWAAAAAVFLVAAGVVTAQGVRFLLSSEQSALRSSDAPSIQSTQESVPGTAEDIDTPPVVPNENGGSPSDAQALSAELGPSYVIFGQIVYRFTDLLTDPPTSPQTGTLTSALDAGGTPATRQVFESPSSDAIVVAGEEGAYLRFEPVTRTLRGRPYELRSSAITAFGQWPQLPPGIPKPSSPDGSPTLISSGTDDAGISIYVLPGSDPSAGFAVAPDTPPSDPAEANPGWTWWEPRR